MSSTAGLFLDRDDCGLFRVLATDATGLSVKKGAMAEVASALLDFSQPMNVELLETTVGVFFGTGTPEQVRLCISDGLRISELIDHLCWQCLSMLCAPGSYKPPRTA